MPFWNRTRAHKRRIQKKMYAKLCRAKETTRPEMALKFTKFILQYTYSVDSTVGVVGIIINIQFVRMVVIINSENNGCTKI